VKTYAETRLGNFLFWKTKGPLKINSASTLFFDPSPEAESFTDSFSDSYTYDEDPARYKKKRHKKSSSNALRKPSRSSPLTDSYDNPLTIEVSIERTSGVSTADPCLVTGSYTKEDYDSNGVKFCSRSEAVCAELLKRYVPNFKLTEGVTFQVAIGTDARGNTLSVDFLVDGVLFEYHPVRLFKNRRRYGDFRSKREYRSYSGICHSLKGEQRDFFQSAMRSTLARHYYAKRRSMLDQHPLYRRMELVVATDPVEFYNLILKRFGKDIPGSVERFLRLFNELLTSGV
jgi:hypothetical protein